MRRAIGGHREKPRRNQKTWKIVASPEFGLARIRPENALVRNMHQPLKIPILRGTISMLFEKLLGRPYSALQRYFAACILFIGLTAVLFSHRWWSVDPFSVYSMPDVDTDGTLWFIWLKAYSGKLFSSLGLTPLLTYPFGFDLAPFPFDNLIDDLRATAIHLAGGGWKAAVFVINASALLAYPLSGCT